MGWHACWAHCIYMIIYSHAYTWSFIHCGNFPWESAEQWMLNIKYEWILIKVALNPMQL